MKAASKLVWVVALVLGLGWFGYGLKANAEVAEDARAAVKEGALLLDVRTVEEFAAGHIDGAVNIPVQNLSQRMGELGAKDKTIVVYCRSGNRSATAKRMMEQAGYQKVIDLGPMSAW